MRYIITGKNLDVTEGMKNAIYEKIGKLEKYFKPETEVRVTFSVQKKDRHKVEVTIPIRGTVIRAEEESTDMYVSIDLVEEIIERQIKKFKNKIIDSKQGNYGLSEAFATETPIEEEEIVITRQKKFPMKPMDPEEACIEMELSGHSFFVFRNSETEQVNVVYKRKGNTYGLIEPEY
jgi:putative sigma-54 modulation protein